MSSILLLQSTASSVIVHLELTAGGAATGLIFSDVLADLQKEGGSFTSKALSGTNFTELGLGSYEIDLTAVDTDTLGNLYVRVSGASITTALVSVYIAAAAPVNPTSPLSIGTTVLFGYIVTLQGSPVVGASVSARTISIPDLDSTGTEGYVKSTSLVTTKTDDDGFFTFPLVTGSEVDIYIPSSNYRRTLTVPSTAQNLFDIS